MNARLQGALVAGIGLGAAYLAASGAYLDFLKPTMRFPLLAAGMTMLVLGTLTLARAVVLRDGPTNPDAGGEHDHHPHGGPAVAWLLVLPLLALGLIDPPALGADAARRDTASALPAPARDHRFDPLPPPRDGAVDLASGEFLARAYWDDSDSLAGVPVRLTGFAVRDPDIADGYQLTRFVMICCAGDALPVRIAVHGVEGPPPPDDTWLHVVGEWIPPADPTVTGPDRGAAIAAATQTEIPAPTYPYE